MSLKIALVIVALAVIGLAYVCVVTSIHGSVFYLINTRREPGGITPIMITLGAGAALILVGVAAYLRAKQ